MNSVVESLYQSSVRRPEHIAIIADGEKISYSDLWNEILGFTSYIKSLNLEKGSRILVKSASSIWYAVAIFSIHLSGNVNVPLESNVSVNGMNDIASQLGASLVIADNYTDGSLPCINSSDVREIAKNNYSENLGFDFPSGDDICDILFTTGTTGKSKGVVISHTAVLGSAENLQSGYNLLDDNVFLIPVPVNHANGIRKFYLCMYTGTTCVLLDGFTNIKKFYQYISDYGVTSLLLPPSAVRMIILLSGKELSKFSKQIRHVHTSAAPFPESDKEKLCELLPETRLIFAYGASEAASCTMFAYSEYPGMICCIGKPNVNANIFIVDDNRQPIKSSKDNQGLLAISGKMLMNCYYNEPELTAEVLKDGVLYTNDIGYIDENGFIYMLGRKGDVINVGGLKIAPTEVESIVMRFPGIAECACFAVEDKMSGVAPKLNIVPERNVTIDTKELKAHMASYLEAYKIPKQIAIVDEIPKTANGKINRKVLK